MLPHALSSLLVFNHGFIQNRSGFFCFCFMRHKYYLMPLNFRRYLFSVNNFFIDEKPTQWNFNTKVKVFHESISCFTKGPWNCILWNTLKEKFNSVSLPLYLSCVLQQLGDIFINPTTHWKRIYIYFVHTMEL